MMTAAFSLTQDGHSRKENQTTGQFRKCIVCGKEFWAKAYKIKMGVARFCSHKCHNTSRMGAMLDKPWAPMALSLYKAGKGCKLIAKELGQSPGTVRSLVMLLGIYQPDRALGKNGVPHNKGARIERPSIYWQRIAWDAEWASVLDCYWDKSRAYARWRQRLCEDKTKPWRARFQYDKLNRTNYYLSKLLRSRVYRVLHGQLKSAPTLVLLGCSVDKFRAHLESQFSDGMGWHNMGDGGWHIDHITPCSAFDLSKEHHQKMCFHYSNMRPLWWRDNLAKGGRMQPHQPSLSI